MSDEIDRFREAERRLAERRRQLGIEDDERAYRAKLAARGAAQAEARPAPAAPRVERTPREIADAMIRALEADAEAARARHEAERAEREALDRAERAAERERNRRNALRVAGAIFPKKHARIAASDAFAETPAVQILREWWDAGRYEVALLRGTHGVGKSGAAACLAWRILLGGGSVSWHTPTGLITSIQHAYSAEAQPIGKDLCVIDEFGKETRPEFCASLVELLDYHKCRVVLCSNLTATELESRYKKEYSDLWDRLREDLCLFPIVGKSMRKGGAGL